MSTKPPMLRNDHKLVPEPVPAEELPASPEVPAGDQVDKLVQVFGDCDMVPPVDVLYRTKLNDLVRSRWNWRLSTQTSSNQALSICGSLKNLVETVYFFDSQQTPSETQQSSRWRRHL